MFAGVSDPFTKQFHKAFSDTTPPLVWVVHVFRLPLASDGVGGGPARGRPLDPAGDAEELPSDGSRHHGNLEDPRKAGRKIPDYRQYRD